ncbi:MAG: tryptophan synthase subunit alpha [bacterium]|nr:tryptophan synthase subunit alpha [bacterium]
MPRSITEQIKLAKQENRMALMTHVVMGYPSLEDTRQRVLLMVQAGVDIIELQLPFSDPLADGPIITVANQTAVKNGVTIKQCMDLATELSSQVEIPLQWVGYYNTVFNYGIEKFIKDSRRAGIQAFTFPDLPIDEEPYEHFFELASLAGIPVIQLVSLITPVERLKEINKLAHSYIYCVARFGVTGTDSKMSDEIVSYLQKVRKYVTVPLAVGFGISQPQHIRDLRDSADVVVVGSALLNLSLPELKDQIQTLCAAL